MNSPAEIAANYSAVAQGKVRLRTGQMLLLSMMAGVFIALAGVGSSAAACSIAAPSLAKLVSALVFPAGLAMVVLAGAELFTGNNLLIIALLERKITLPQMLRNWCLVYLGNFLGSVLVAALAVYSHQLSNFSGALAVSAISTAAAKCSLTFSDAFLRGIACNFLVCIAVWMTMAAKDVTGKLLGLYFPILLFVVAGFEHSVANMFYGTVGLLANSTAEYAAMAAQSGVDTAALTIGHFLLGNLLPVTLGNIVGGLTVGVVYWCCYLSKK